MSDPDHNGWTLSAYVAHNEALRVAEERFQKERDRRYFEVKAADSRALALQAEKDQKHFLDLNHEQARIALLHKDYLPRETYAADRKDKLATGLAVFAIILEIVMTGFLWWSNKV